MRAETGKISMTAQAMEIVRVFMGDGAEHPRKEVVREIREKISDKETLTDGVIAGAIKVMVEHGELECIEKGIYKMNLSGAKAGLRQKGIRLLTRFQRDLSKLCVVNVLQMDEEDMEYIKSLQALSESIKNNEILIPKVNVEDETSISDNVEDAGLGGSGEPITPPEQPESKPETKDGPKVEMKTGQKKEEMQGRKLEIKNTPKVILKASPIPKA